MRDLQSNAGSPEIEKIIDWSWSSLSFIQGSFNGPASGNTLGCRPPGRVIVPRAVHELLLGAASTILFIVLQIIPVFYFF